MQTEMILKRVKPHVLVSVVLTMMFSLLIYCT